MQVILKTDFKYSECHVSGHNNNHAAANTSKVKLYLSPIFQTAMLGNLKPLAASFDNKRYWKEIYLFATLKKKKHTWFWFLNHISFRISKINLNHGTFQSFEMTILKKKNQYDVLCLEN